MDPFQSHALSTSCWLSLQAVPLFVSPRLMVNLLAPEPRAATDLETYFSRTLALTLFTLSLLPILLTGLVPLLPSHQSAEQHDPDHEPSPYAAAATFITTAYHTASLIYCYLTYQSSGSVCFAFGMVGSGAMASWGLLALIFGGGDDKKRVSGWPFRNKEEREAKREKMRRRKGI